MCFSTYVLKVKYCIKRVNENGQYSSSHNVTGNKPIPWTVGKTYIACGQKKASSKINNILAESDVYYYY